MEEFLSLCVLFLQYTRLAVSNLTFVFPNVELKLKVVVSSLSADHGLSPVCTPCLLKLAFITTIGSAHKKLAAEQQDV